MNEVSKPRILVFEQNIFQVRVIFQKQYNSCITIKSEEQTPHALNESSGSKTNIRQLEQNYQIK